MISPEPEMLPAELRLTLPSLSAASTGALTAMVPLPVVEIEIVEVVPALLTPVPPIVIPPPAFVRVIAPQPLPGSESADETLLNVTVPPPD